MAGRIPQHFIDELIARTDIIEVIGSRVQLKKAGREWKACCPFHGEKTPSFTVSQVKQFYHCFGCGAHGTALTFLMEHDRMPFPEAVEDLAGRVGLEVPREGGGPDPRDRALEDLYALMAQADQHFREQLRDSDRAKEYLKNRGLVGETAARYHLGYAPPGWDAVLKKFGATDAGREALLATGLIIERSADAQRGQGPGYYDRFRDRVMFPIRDSRGRVVGFGGRVIDQGEPKYLNSPETALFHKGRELYGLYEARQELRNIERLLVVEGYMDVVRLAQAGVYYAVATLGTATTPEHLNRIFRITGDVVFSFDGDRAGRQAAWRALETCLAFVKEGRQIKFLFLPDGEDPDTLVAKEGRAAFEERIANAMPLSEYLVTHLAAETDLTSVDGRARLAEMGRPLLSRVPDGVYRELLIDRLAREVRMSPARLAGLLGLAGASSGRGPLTPVRRPARTSTGRGSLASQAITQLIQFPTIAEGVKDPESLRLGGDRGLSVLAELIETLHGEPTLTTAQLLERWRDRPEHERLAQLAAAELPDLPEDGVRREFLAAIARLVRESGPEKRLDELIEKAANEGLSDVEKQELRGLQRRLRTPPGG
jgi:DNA primase